MPTITHVLTPCNTCLKYQMVGIDDPEEKDCVKCTLKALCNVRAKRTPNVTTPIGKLHY